MTATAGPPPPVAALAPDPTRLIGRGAEITLLGELFAADDARAVTITGVAGVGKTRLAREFAAGQVGAGGRFPRGVWFCDCAPVATVDELARALAAAAQAQLPPGRDPVEAAGQMLDGAGPVLVLLDNFEHLVAHAAPAVQHWLAGARAARWLVTSRQRLAIRGEQTFELHPLATADGARSPAVQLLLDRVRAVRGPFEPAPAELAAAQDIAAQLDGLPLAIELAAVRSTLMDLATLGARLRDDLRILGAAPAGAPPRHATLEAAIRGSWDLLAPHEQRALAWCASFRGGFALDAAEFLIGPEMSRAGADAVATLQALRDKSLVAAGVVGPATAGEVRLALYESVREFAARMLAECDGPGAAYARHGEYYAAAGARRADPAARDQAASLQWLSREYANLQAALERATAAAPADPAALARAARLALCMAPLVAVHRVGQRFAATLAEVAALSPALPAATRARLLHLHAVVLRQRGEQGRCTDALEQALRVARDAGETAVWAEVLAALGPLCFDRGAVRQAILLLRRALAAAEALGDRALEAGLRADLGAMEYASRRDPAARELRRAQDQLRATGQHRRSAIIACNLAVHYLDRGQHEHALGCCEEGLALARALGSRQLAGEHLLRVGAVRADQGELAAAQTAFAQAYDEFAAVGALRERGMCAGYLGLVAQEQRRFADALAHYAEAEQRLRDCHVVSRAALWLACAGGTLAQCDRVADAEAALARVAALGGAQDPARALVVALQQALLDLARAREALRAGDVARAEHSLARVAAVQRRAEQTETDSEIRTLQRLVRGELAGVRPPDTALVVARDGRYFRAPGCPPVDLVRQRTLRRVLVGLAAQRERRPGVGLDVAALAPLGWPGESLRDDVAYNRVYVAISTLRGRGLGGTLLARRDDGWSLDPAVPLIWAD